ncbi:heat shock 70 kDa protein 12A-like [Saccostrea cucullata]|uniref:heat shock 70 kDa protein 12A-like n=1 Tax=Saccostrea cuccullata TaxID=36930 RepID=UPI002ED0BE26
MHYKWMKKLDQALSLRHIGSCGCRTKQSVFRYDDITRTAVFVFKQEEGGSVDGTVFEIQPDKTIKELFPSTGGDWCGSLALQEYLKFLERIFGNEIFKDFKLKEPGEVLEIYKEFGNQTKITSADSERKYIALWIPAALLEMSLAKKTVEELNHTIDLVSKIYKGDVSLRGNKLKISLEVFRKFFEPSIYKISGYLHNLLRHPNAQDVEVILLVGGFSEFTIITDPITKEFSSYKFIIPKDSGVSALVGALIFGHNPLLIQERLSNYTYGCVAVYDKQKFSTDETPVGSGHFDRLVEIGHPLKIGRVQVKKTYSPDKDVKNISIYLYGSTKANPVLVNDKSCFYLGSVALRLPHNTIEKREVKLEVSLKGSMIELTLVDSLSGKSADASVNTSYKVHSNEYLLVGAIDFGTTYSGYAFSSKQDYDDNPTEITGKIWTASSGHLQSQKIPTCALFTPQKTFHSFGYEAEDKYATLSLENTHHDWYFFRRFKMKLYNELTITEDFQLESLDGKMLSAVLVFCSVIGFLREEMLSKIHFSNINIHEYGLRWVITVPAIWTDASKCFMRKCALQAGIDDDRLVIALEPEAAAMYSNLVAIRNQKSDIRLTSGTKYIVCDAGGGTVDITVHEMIDDEGHVRELYKASGGNWGGTSVDEELLQLYEKIVGKDVMAEFKYKYPEDALEMARELETKKRSFSSNVDRVSFPLPLSMMQLFKKKTGKRLSMTVIHSNSLEKYMAINGDKIRVTGSYIRTCFDRSIEKICEHLKKILKNLSADDVGLILLVGGYAESSILQSALLSTFPSKKLLVPKEAGLSVLKGAVIFGHNPYLILERKAKYTYGIKCREPFVDGKHRQDYKVQDKDEIWCANVFSRHVTIGDTLIAGKTQSTKTYTKQKNANSAHIAVYASLEENPMYITDAGCFYLGGKILEFENGRALGASCLEVQMAFGGTEIELTMTCKVTGRVTKLHLENDRQ